MVINNITRYYLTICFYVDIFNEEKTAIKAVKEDVNYEEKSISVIGR